GPQRPDRSHPSSGPPRDHRRAHQRRRPGARPLSDAALPLPPLPPRDPAGHKGTFGTVAIVGGCATPATRMIGAPALAALAALRAGAGLARLVMPAPILDAGLTITPSATGRPLPTDATGAVIPHEA